MTWNQQYRLRYAVLRPLRWAIRMLSGIIGGIPGTTFGEVAEMHNGPCRRCVGHAVVAETVAARKEHRYA